MVQVRHVPAYGATRLVRVPEQVDEGRVVVLADHDAGPTVTSPDPHVTGGLVGPAARDHLTGKQAPVQVVPDTARVATRHLMLELQRGRAGQPEHPVLVGMGEQHDGSTARDGDAVARVPHLGYRRWLFLA